MVDAPEKIRVAQDSDGFWTCREAISGSQEYVRADLVAELAEENERLREDKARLDFLDACNQRLNSTYGTSYGWKMVMNHNVNRLMTGHHLDVDLNDFEGFGAKSCRQAIDAERRRVEGARRAAPPTSELEAENTRLKARLAEALKALGMMLREHDILSGNFGDVMDPKHRRPDRWPTAAEAARRVLEGCEGND